MFNVWSNTGLFVIYTCNEYVLVLIFFRFSWIRENCKTNFINMLLMYSFLFLKKNLKFNVMEKEYLKMYFKIENIIKQFKK